MHILHYIYIYISFYICTRDININTESDKGKGGEVPVTQCTDIFVAMNGDTRFFLSMKSGTRVFFSNKSMNSDTHFLRIHA